MMDVAARLPRSRLSAVIFLYGSLVAAFVSFVVYGRQALVEGTVDLNGFGELARNLAHGDGFSLGPALPLLRCSIASLVRLR